MQRTPVCRPLLVKITRFILSNNIFPGGKLCRDGSEFM